jgi:hypothetical protein
MPTNQHAGKDTEYYGGHTPECPPKLSSRCLLRFSGRVSSNLVPLQKERLVGDTRFAFQPTAGEPCVSSHLLTWPHVSSTTCTAAHVAACARR